MHSKEREDFEAGLAGFLATLHTGSTHTQQAYERDIRRFIQFLVERQVPELRSVDIHCVREYVAARHRQGASGASLSRALSALRKWFTYLGARNLVDANPALNVRAPKGERRLPRALDVDQMASMLEQPAEDFLALRDRTMWEILYSSGLRVSELVGLNLSDVNLAVGELRVLGKGRKERVTPLGSKAADWLVRWLSFGCSVVGVVIVEFPDPLLTTSRLTFTTPSLIISSDFAAA